MKNKGKSDTLRGVATPCDDGPGRIRTYDQSIMSRRPDSIAPETTTVYDDTPETPASNHDSLTENDPDLAAVVEAWADLPDAVRAGIVAMVRASASDGPGRNTD